MTKSTLISNINKYYLGGLVESVVWHCCNTTATIEFISTTNSTAGCIYFPFKDMGDADHELGVFSTSALLRFLNILQDDIEIIPQQEHNVWMRMLINDGIYEGIYSLADTRSIPPAPKVKEPKKYEITFNIDKDFKDQFSKAYKALESINRFTIQAAKDIKIILGEKGSYGNKVSFNKTSPDISPLKQKPFSAEALFNILKTNSDEGIISVSEEGLMKVTYTFENGGVTYYLVELEEV